jgi:hypothetical protein
MQPLMNPLHIEYVLSDFAGNLNRFDYLFPLLEGIDPYERRWFFPNRLQSSFPLPGGEFMDVRLDREFDAFKVEMLSRVELGLRECSVVFSYVSETLNVLRRLGCPHEAQFREVNLRHALEVMRELKDSAIEPVQRAPVLASLEELLVNLRANTQLYATRYDLFCTQVVGSLIPKKGAAGSFAC